MNGSKELIGDEKWEIVKIVVKILKMGKTFAM